MRCLGMTTISAEIVIVVVVVIVTVIVAFSESALAPAPATGYLPSPSQRLWLPVRWSIQQL